MPSFIAKLNSTKLIFFITLDKIYLNLSKIITIILYYILHIICLIFNIKTKNMKYL